MFDTISDFSESVRTSGLAALNLVLFGKGKHIGGGGGSGGGEGGAMLGTEEDG